MAATSEVDPSSSTSTDPSTLIDTPHASTSTGPSGGVIESDSRTSPRGFLRVMTYNVLAQTYCKATFLPYVIEPRFRSWKYRGPNLISSIAHHAPDILCLQEVDFYPEFWNNQLRLLGYKSSYYKRPRKSEGLLLAWQTDRLVPLTQEHVINLNELDDIMAHSRENYYNRGNIGIVAAFSFVNLQEEKEFKLPGFIFSTTHLYWDPDCEDIKQTQIEYLLFKLQEWVDLTFPSSKQMFPLILAGDFNSEPCSSVYRFVTKGEIKKIHRPRFSESGKPLVRQKQDAQPEEATRGKQFVERYEPSAGPSSHPFSLESAYATSPDGEPFFTNYTPKWQGTIDYIFFSSKLLQCVKTEPMPSTEAVSCEGKGLPNSKYPSDHLPLVADFIVLEQTTQ